MTIHSFDGYDAEAWIEAFWTPDDIAAAKAEDWAIWQCQGGWCIDAYELEKVEDTNPWLSVCAGTSAHHVKARAFIEHYSRRDWKAMNDWYEIYGRS